MWWLTTMAHAVTYTVCSPTYPQSDCLDSIQEALDAGADEILLTPGLHETDSTVIRNRKVVIRADDPSILETTTIRAAAGSKTEAALTVEAGSVTLEDVFIQGYPFFKPLKKRLDEDDPSIRGLRITNGAIVVLRRVKIANGFHRENGGGIYADGGSRLSVIDSSLSTNEAVQAGGQIYVQDSALALDRTEFLLGLASDGAGITVDGGALSVEDCLFDSNRALDGGAIKLASVDRVTVQRTWFCFNSGPVGGAISGQESCGEQCSLSNNFFYGNYSDVRGGALYFEDEGTNVSVFRNTFYLNKALQYGAVAEVRNAEVFSFQSNLVYANASANAVVAQEAGVLSMGGNAWRGNTRQDLSNLVLEPQALGATDIRLAEDPVFLETDDERLTPCAQSLVLDPDAPPNAALVEGGIGAFTEDYDLDGVPVWRDCNDNDRSVFPGAREIPGDGVDSNCDGLEACFVDGDADGFGSQVVETPFLGCNEAPFVPVGGDCRDDDPNIGRCSFVVGGGGCSTVPGPNALWPLALLLGWISVCSGTTCSSSRWAHRS